MADDSKKDRVTNTPVEDNHLDGNNPAPAKQTATPTNNQVAATNSAEEVSAYKTSAMNKDSYKEKTLTPPVDMGSIVENKQASTNEPPAKESTATKEDVKQDKGGNSKPPKTPPTITQNDRHDPEEITAHSRMSQDLLLLLDRIFSHPRYAIFITFALLILFFTHHWIIVIPFTIFFVVEIGLRIWQQKRYGWRNKVEIFFIAVDVIATISLIVATVIQVVDVESALFLRVVRILRGISMLRTLRVFRMFSDETAVYSNITPVISIAISFVAVWLDHLIIAAVSLLSLELIYRLHAIFKVLPAGRRRQAEVFFVGIDLIATVAITGFGGLPQELLVIRIFRFLIMLNPLGTVFSAVANVINTPELRQEMGMLVGGFFLLQGITLFVIVYFYPEMDLNSDGNITDADSAPFQIILYTFMVLLDPGSAPKDVFGPWFVIPTAMIVLSGVFLFALIVGLGSNVMDLMLKELANSPLSARIQLLFGGWNENSESIMASFDRLSNRMRRSFPSVWLFFGTLHMVRVGRWANLRVAKLGARRVLQQFKLTGLHQTIIFTSNAKQGLIGEEHSILREFMLLRPEATPLIISDDTPEAHIHSIYTNEMKGEVISSAELSARMLYQMHHSPYMAELGIHFLDTVGQESGLHAVEIDIVISPVGDNAEIQGEDFKIPLSEWFHQYFSHGINVLAFRSEQGEYILAGDLLHCRKAIHITDFIAIGRDHKTWKDVAQADEAPSTTDHLLPFTWPDTWDFNMIFMGWHAGLPAMLLEMSKKHHKLGLHVLLPGKKSKRERALKALIAATQKQNSCQITVQVHAWDGLSVDALTPLLRGCKAIILYPEDTKEGYEDSLLELWFHLTANALSIQKERMKWWTPPKIMLLPRDLSDIGTFNRATLDYPLLKIDCGSPDAFHDTYIAKRLLSEVLRARSPELYAQELKCFELVNLLLSDAIIVEDIEPHQLVDEEKNIDWNTFYLNCVNRGWSPVAIIPPVYERPAWLDAAERWFPSDTDIAGSGLQLLAGRKTTEIMPVSNTARILLCRRGVLSETAEVQHENVTDAVAKTTPTPAAPIVPVVSESPKEPKHDEVVMKVKDEAATQHKVAVEEKAPEQGGEKDEVVPEVEQQQPQQDNITAQAEEEQPKQDEVETETVAETAVATEKEELAHEDVQAVTPVEVTKEGEIMSETVWPKHADQRLIRVMQAQIQGSLDLLHQSTDDGLAKLMDAMDQSPGGQIEADILAALTDLQNIDRVMQRITNVMTCLEDWGNATDPSTGQPLWEEEVSKRYVMEEERQTLRKEL